MYQHVTSWELVSFAMTMIGGKLNDDLVEAGTSTKQYSEAMMGYYNAASLPSDTTEEIAIRSEALQPFWEMGFNKEWMWSVMRTYCERRFCLTDTRQNRIA